MANQGSYALACGTSMATPAVAGVALLVWSQYPSWTRDQVRTRLQSTAIDLGPAGRDAQFGYGRVDAPRAVHGVLGASISGPGTPSGGLQTWSAGVGNGVVPIDYLWERRDFCSQNYQTVGQGPTYSEQTVLGDAFYLRLTVTSIGRNATAMKLVGGFKEC
jgi:hypothetical protein